MNLKSEYLRAWKEAEIERDTIVFITEKEAASIAEKVLIINPQLRDKKQIFIENLEEPSAVEWLAKAEYIVSNMELPVYFSKRTNQVYLQIINTNEWSANFTRLLLHADYIVEQKEANPFPTNFKKILKAKIISAENCANFEFEASEPAEPAKKNIVMYCGGFKNNGITSSALNLMYNLDQEKYQLIVIEQENLDYYEALNIEKVPDHVIKIRITGDLNIFPEEEEGFLDFHCHPLEHMMKHGPTGFLTDEIKSIYQRELTRVLGDTRIDVALDFDGYFKYWTLLLASSNSENKIIYQHNEMMEEYSKKLGKKFKHRADLNFIFPLYNYFDHVVSVAEQTGEVNRKNLEHVVEDTSKMTYIHNSIDYKSILRSAKEDNGIEVPDDTFNFVTMGRLSPEKNHKGMIKAFSKVHEKHEKTQLFIIGLGELEQDLKDYARELGLENEVHVLGQLENPFPTIDACDAFVMSSIHEGQPMVLLECLVLRKKIVSTNIPGCYSVLKDGYGLLVEKDIDSLVAGMEEIMETEETFKTFDYEAYNQEAVQMLEKVLEGE